MKRLLCILSSMNAGGAETFLMKIYRSIDRSKYQFDFCINVKNECFYEKEIIALGGKIYRIPSKTQSLRQFKKRLTEIIKNKQYKYVLRITASAMGFMDLKIAKKSGSLICSARSSNSNVGNSLKLKFAHLIGRILYSKYVDVRIAPADLAAQYTFGKKLYKKGKVYILHNAIDLDVYKFDEQVRKNIRNEFSIADNIKIVGHVGRFSEQKNHLFLLDIFYKIHCENPNTVLMLVGKGGLEGQIKNKVAELKLDKSVIFTGVRSDVPALLSAMDVFVFPSFYEGMPNTVIEAQATGLPCIVSDTITREANVTGLVYYLSLRDPVKWAEETLRINNKNRVSMKKIMTEKGYGIENVCKEFIGLAFGKDEEFSD